MLSRILGFFTFSAFRPLIDNTMLPLITRMGRRRMLFVAHGPGGYTIATIELRAKSLPVVTLIAHSTDASSIETVMATAKQKTKLKHVVLSLSDGNPNTFPTSSISRIPGPELAMRLATKPSEVLGHSYLAGRGYSGFFHTDMSQGIFASIGNPTLNAAVQAAAAHGLKVVRTQISVIPLLDVLLADPRVRNGSHHPVVLDQGVATYIPHGTAGEWLDARSRPFIGHAQPLATFLSSIAANITVPLLVLDSGCNGPNDLSRDLATVPGHVLFEPPDVAPGTLAAVAASFN